jgi:hypothetical protein
MSKVPPPTQITSAGADRAARGPSRRRRLGAGAAVAPLLVTGGAALITLSPAPAGAATLTVTSLADSGAGSLRQALADAGPGDTVAFQAGLTGTITLTSGQLVVDESVTIAGPGASVLTVSGNDASRVFYLYSNAGLLEVTISGLTVADGSANDGGGIFNLDENATLQDVVVTGNDATADGGGVWSDGFTGTLEVIDSTISGNTAGDDGGGIYNEDTADVLRITGSTISGNTASDDGGGIYLYDPDAAVEIVGTTIADNTAGDLGGGVYLYSIDGGDPITIRRTTISGNSATAGSGAYFYDVSASIQDSTISGNEGGPALSAYGEPIELLMSTVTANTADGVDSAQPVTATGSIISGNTGDDVSSPVQVVSDHSLLGTVPGGVDDQGGTVSSTTPGLGPLADNGGPTLTHLPDAGSQAIDAGPDPVPTFPDNTVDQRGEARVFNGTSDIGSVEVQDEAGPAITVATPADGATYVLGEQVLADYACTDDGTGGGVATCDGPFADGAAIDTSAAGTFTFTVVATDVSGNSTAATTTYAVVAAGGDVPGEPVAGRPSFAG